MPESYAGSGIRESLGFGRGACDGCYLSQEPDERLYGLRFLLPHARYEQMLLFMDKLVNKKAVYHIYTKKSGRLV